MFRSAATLFEQITGLQGRLPALAIRLRPLIDGSAASLVTLQFWGHLPCPNLFGSILWGFLWRSMLLTLRKSRIVLSKCRTAAGVSKPV